MGAGAGAAVGAIVGAAIQAGTSAANTRAAIAADALAAGKAFKRQKVLDELAYQRSRRFRRTAHQDTTLDLERAGLNRILSVSRGATGTNMTSGATAPHAAGTGSRSIEAGTHAGRAITSAMKAFQEWRSLKADTKSKEETPALIKAQVEKTEAEEDTARALRVKYTEDAKNAAANKALTDVETQIRQELIPSAKAQGEFDRTPVGKGLRKMKRGIDAFNPLKVTPGGSR